MSQVITPSPLTGSEQAWQNEAESSQSLHDCFFTPFPACFTSDLFGFLYADVPADFFVSLCADSVAFLAVDERVTAAGLG